MDKPKKKERFNLTNGFYVEDVDGYNLARDDQEEYEAYLSSQGNKPIEDYLMQWFNGEITKKEAKVLSEELSKRLQPKKELNVDECIRFYMESEFPDKEQNVYIPHEAVVWCRRFFTDFCQRFKPCAVDKSKELLIEVLNNLVISCKTEFELDGSPVHEDNMKRAKQALKDEQEIKK